MATQTTARSSIELGAVTGGPFREVVAESGAQSSFVVADTRGRLYYTARLPSGWATFRSEPGGGRALVAADLWRAIPSPDASFVIGRHPDRGLMRVNADGSGAAVVVQDASSAPVAFTPDGAGFVYVSNR